VVSHRDTSKINLVSKTKFQYPVDIGIPQISDPGLSKGVTTGNFSKIEKLPQTSPNFLKIVENFSFHQNNYFRSIDR
jgi:hypothetical protein